MQSTLRLLRKTRRRKIDYLVSDIVAFYLPSALVLIHRESLSSLVIDHLLRVLHGREKICIMWLYCDYRDEVRQTAKQMICLLLKQAISSHRVLCKTIIEKLWKLKKSETNLTLEETCLVLTNTIRLFDRVYICIDALDEFQQQRSLFLHSLQEILQSPELKNSFRIFFTGRPQVVEYMEKYFASPTLVRIEAMRDDIVKYIEHQIKLDDTGLTMSVKFTKEIMRTIVSTSEGM